MYEGKSGSSDGFEDKDKSGGSMSPMKKHGIRVCCRSGRPSATGGCGNYSPVGKVVQLTRSGPAAYYTRPKRGRLLNSSALIVIYDIFGIDILQTRRFADLLAKRTHRRVVMPDVFRGRPWLLKNFPPKNEKKFIKWVETAGSWDVVSATNMLDESENSEYATLKMLETSTDLSTQFFSTGPQCLFSAKASGTKLGLRYIMLMNTFGSFEHQFSWSLAASNPDCRFSTERWTLNMQPTSALEVSERVALFKLHRSLDPGDLSSFYSRMAVSVDIY
ncbi:hypothetical protein CLF_105874 [Clonorchis sinensis]|uniref:Uncharacterized protein n=1 Tax=Clonorchis sinensis TaxID=79923 RepID=G7YEC8_CLOSI|nr:hypothetical protein CLF_105874 [Clonorchis sinensis]